jgi:hypothetical protein
VLASLQQAQTFL